MNRKIKAFIPAILWGILVFILSATPGGTISKWAILNLPYADKIVHMGFYGILSILLLVGYLRSGYKIVLINSPVIISILFCSFYGIAIEWMQDRFFEERYFEFLDIIANIIGSLVGVGIFFFFRKNKL